jgi:hypothetical protein
MRPTLGSIVATTNQTQRGYIALSRFPAVFGNLMLRMGATRIAKSSGTELQSYSA